MNGLTWYIFDGMVGEHYVQILLGPAEPGEKRTDGEPWETPFFTSFEDEPLLLNHRGTFDHEPTDDEQLDIVPEEHKDKWLSLTASSDEEEVEEEDEEAHDAELELDDEETVALSLAIAARVEQLSAISDRHTVLYGSRKMAEACTGQIEALTRIWERLELTNRPWDF